MGGKDNVPSGDQIRMARLTQEGNSAEEDPAKINRLIRKVIETTRCTQAQAELALFDNDNDVELAVLYILDNAEAMDSWTETKSKGKTKKVEEEEPIRNRFSASRGRGSTQFSQSRPEFNDRSRFNGPSAGRGVSRGASAGVARGGRRGGFAGSGPGRSDRPAPRFNGNQPDVVEKSETNDWKSGPLTFTKTEEAAPAPSVSSTTAASAAAPVPTPAPVSQGPPGPAPISFAAVAAAAANKDKRPPPAAPAPAPVQVPEPKHAPAPSPKPAPITVPAPASTSQEEVPSVSSPVSAEVPASPVPVEEVPAPAASPVATVPQVETDDLTNKLKNDLGIGESPQQRFSYTQQEAPVPAPSLAPGPVQTVEFVSDASSSSAALPEYQFGFLAEPVAEPVAAPQESIFSTARTIQQQQPPKPAEPAQTHMNGDYTMKASPPSMPASSAYPQSRTLSYESSTVTYAPTDRAPKPQQPQQQQQPSQPNLSQMFQAPPSMYPTSYPNPYLNMNMNMYSPAGPGMRTDDYATLMQQYPFGMGQIDLSTILPQGTLGTTQAGPAPGPPSGPHRTDAHMDKGGYSSQSRDSSVAPPPGFGNPSFMQPNQLSSLFMPQQFNPHHLPYMMPNVAAGRQMYQQEDERKHYDKMGKDRMTGAQATPPPHHNHYQQQQNTYLAGLGGGPGKKPYSSHNWNN